MNLAIMLTAYNRPSYLRQTLETWEQVRGFYEIPLHVQLEPSPQQDETLALLREIGHPDLTITLNEQVEGPVRNAWLGMNKLFEGGFDFVIKADDDLIVSEDILEYFDWAFKHFASDTSVSLINAYRGEKAAPGREFQVVAHDEFHPWVWGTWADRWFDSLSPNWDKGVALLGPTVVRPVASRVASITTRILGATQSFWEKRPKGDYSVVDSL